MELIKKDIHTDSRKGMASMQATLEKDINISDSKPDAAKLIMHKARVCINEVKVSDGRIQVSGKLVFSVLYLTEDDHKMAAMDGEILLEEKINMDGVCGMDEVTVTAELEDFTTELINSRKYSVRSLIRLQAVCDEILTGEIAVDVAERSENGEVEVEHRKKTIRALPLILKKRDIYRLKAEVEIPGSFPNIEEMIWDDIHTGNLEFRFQQDKIAIQGENRIFFIYRGEEKESLHYEITVPFTGMLDCDGVTEGMIPEISYSCGICNMAVRPDFDGEERIVTFEVPIEMNIQAYEEEELDILADVYGVTREAAVNDKEQVFRRYLGRSSGKCKAAGQFPARDNGGAVRILHAGGEVKVQETEAEENGIEIAGFAAVCILYECREEEKGYGILREILPFRYVLENDVPGEDCEYSIHCDLEQLSASVIEEDVIDIKCVFNVQANRYCYFKERVIETVETAEPDPKKMEELPSLAIYMVRDKESLWDIGKRYYVPVSRIREVNQLAEDTVKKGDKLLIMR